MRQRLVFGNWKMNGTFTTITSLLQKTLNLPLDSLTNRCVVFPPTVYLQHVRDLLRNSAVLFGAQNVYPEDFGAFTGEISGSMLTDIGCRYVLVGHSERRSLFNESNEFIAKKFHYVKSRGMTPVLCVGETLDERKNAVTEKVIKEQISSIMHCNDKNLFHDCVIAYEPVWAIGTGETATAEEAQSVHGFIRELVANFDEASAINLPIIYGGSVNETNCRDLFTMPDVDGGLIGGASLDAQKFEEIIRTAFE